jgi:hypothetical protein
MVDRSHTISTAAAEIFALINSRAQSPWPQEIEAIIAKTHAPSDRASAVHLGSLTPSVIAAAPADISPLHAEIKRVAAEYREACVAADREGFAIEADSQMEPLRKRLKALAGQLPQVGTPAILTPSLNDVIAWATVADAFAREEKNGNGWPMLYEGNDDNIAVGNLITAVLALEARGLPGAWGSSAISADHLKYREIIAEIAKFDEEGCPQESEATLEALSEQAMALERKVWATPARTLADVLLRGEMALHNENGVMENLDDPEAYYDERANAQLIRAVVDVLGGNNAS